MGLTKKQLALRRTGITSTDISAICGLNPYKSAMEVYLDKIGKPVEHEETEAQLWGQILEEPIAKEYAKRNDFYLWNPRKTYSRDWQMATPDRFVWAVRGEDTCWILEVKTAGAATQVQRWGKGGDEVPEEYLIQNQWGMGVTGMNRCDMAVLLGTYHGFEYRQFTLTFDPALFEKVVEMGRAFRENYVEKRIAPPPDGSASARKALQSLYCRPEPQVLLADATGEELMNDLLLAEDAYKYAEAERERITQLLMAQIGDSEGLESPNIGKVLWKADKKGHRRFTKHFKGMEGG